MDWKELSRRNSEAEEFDSTAMNCKHREKPRKPDFFLIYCRRQANKKLKLVWSLKGLVRGNSVVQTTVEGGDPRENTISITLHAQLPTTKYSVQSLRAIKSLKNRNQLDSHYLPSEDTSYKDTLIKTEKYERWTKFPVTTVALLWSLL